MTGKEISERIKKSERKTPVKAYISSVVKPMLPKCRIFGENGFFVAFGAWEDMEKSLAEQSEIINCCEIEIISRKNALGKADLLSFDARIEEGAYIREGAEIGKGAIVMHGAIINSGAKIGEGAMIDMNAVVGSCAEIGKNAHIGACHVIAGVLEPPSAVPTRIGSGAFIGAGAVVLEGGSVGDNAVIGAGAVVTRDVPSSTVAVGVPARATGKRAADFAKAGINGDLR